MADESGKGFLEEGMLINEKWEIVSHIASGGKGEVYLASQRGLDRKVALKVISKAYLESLEDDHEGVAAEIGRFRREVKLLAQMRHPNIIQVFDFDHVEINNNSFEYIVMEYVAGTDLTMTYPESGMGQEELAVTKWILKYYLPILQGVEAVHARGIIHRDLKPANVLIADDIPKIVDFGLAGCPLIDTVTRSCDIMGSLPYMPEEQLYGLSHLDVRSDIFALGRMLFEAISGSLVKSKVPPFLTVGLNNPATPFFKRLDRIMRQATAKDQNKRFSSAKSLRESLEELLEYAPVNTSRRKNVRLLIGISIVLVLLLAGGIAYHFLFEAARSVDKGSPLTLDSVPHPHEPGSPNEGKGPQEMNPLLDQVPQQKELTGSDGSVLVYVPGSSSDLEASEVQHQRVAVNSFYMDKTQITNYQYIEFLRKNKERLEVKGKAVYGDGQLWLLLGEVTEGYEPIVYRKEKFVLQPEAAATPVVRVTAIGAVAYANTYGRRLPTMTEWKYARAGLEDTASISAGTPPPIASSAQPGSTASPPAFEPGSVLKSASSIVYPVSEEIANRLGIKGLGANVNEWVTHESKSGALVYHVHGGVDPWASANEYIERQAWEAFPTLGFRTVISQ